MELHKNSNVQLILKLYPRQSNNIIFSKSKRGQTPILISHTMQEPLLRHQTRVSVILVCCCNGFRFYCIIIASGSVITQCNKFNNLVSICVISHSLIVSWIIFPYRRTNHSHTITCTWLEFQKIIDCRQGNIYKQNSMTRGQFDFQCWRL